MDKIEEKWKKLRATGLDLGNPLAIQDPVQTESARRYGGSMRQYERGSIYWHPVMGGEAREVHGGILVRYVAEGGPGENLGTQTRQLGFPVSDETLTADGLYSVSYFEWGAIYWKEGAGKQYGDLYKAWLKTAAESGPMGYPISEPELIAGGEAVYYERGCLWKGPASNNQVLSFSLEAPLLGHPEFWNPDAPSGTRLPIKILCPSGLGVLAALHENRPDLFSELWNGRLFLQRVVAKGVPAEELPIQCVPSSLAVPEPGNENFASVSSLVCLISPNQEPTDRALYNVVCHAPQGRTAVLFPHAIYARRSWSNFGFIHATDLHVSRRLDTLRQQLAGLEGENEYINFNDMFRDFIRYANHLYDVGLLDVVILSGDLVDYIFEDGENRNGGGNFKFFQDLVLGQDESPDRAAAEEIRVPIFTILGNHDYRSNAYPIVGGVDLKASDFIGDLPLIGGQSVYWKKLSNFEPLNLTLAEAHVLVGGHKAFNVPLYPAFGRQQANKFAEVDAGMRAGSSYYFKRINSERSYMVRLGIHRIVMLDTGWDAGIVTGAWKALEWKLGYGSEDEAKFLGGNPNLAGISTQDLDLVKKAQAEADASGLVVVAMHAPPINVEGNEYAHYFRETERSTTDPHLKQAIGQEVTGFLYRHAQADFFHSVTMMKGSGRSGFRIERVNPSTVHADWVRNGASFFKQGDISDLLDDGVSRGPTTELLTICAGNGSTRPVDLVLFGHVHRNVEFRMGLDPSTRTFQFFHDYYSENPAEYYPSKVIVRDDFETSQQIRVFVDAPVEPSPVRVRDDAFGAAFRYPFTPEEEWRLGVPRNAQTLNEAVDVGTWWDAHRPLLLQTAALGPIDQSQRLDRSKSQPPRPNPTFRGFRFISVENNAMTKIRYVRLPELQSRNFRLDWEP